MKYFRLLTAALLASGIVGCSKPAEEKPAISKAEQPAPTGTPPIGTPVPQPPEPPGPDIKLTATLVDPINIDLKWVMDAKDPKDFGGYFVQFATRMDEEFITLDILPPSITTYHHPDLVPETHFIYRVRPYYGKLSEVVNVTTGEATDEESNGTDEPKQVPAGTGGTKSVHDPNVPAPSEFKAVLASPRVVNLSWKDEVNDEEGYLVEGSSDPNQDFRAIALLDPDTISFQVPSLPAKTKCYFRVRAYYFGRSSNFDDKTTGLDPNPQPPMEQMPPGLSEPAEPAPDAAPGKTTPDANPAGNKLPEGAATPATPNTSSTPAAAPTTPKPDEDAEKSAPQSSAPAATPK